MARIIQSLPGGTYVKKLGAEGGLAARKCYRLLNQAGISYRVMCIVEGEVFCTEVEKTTYRNRYLTTYYKGSNNAIPIILISARTYTKRHVR